MKKTYFSFILLLKYQICVCFFPRKFIACYSFFSISFWWREIKKHKIIVFSVYFCMYDLILYNYNQNYNASFIRQRNLFFFSSFICVCASSTISISFSWFFYALLSKQLVCVTHFCFSLVWKFPLVDHAIYPRE